MNNIIHGFFQSFTSSLSNGPKSVVKLKTFTNLLSDINEKLISFFSVFKSLEDVLLRCMYKVY